MSPHCSSIVSSVFKRPKRKDRNTNPPNTNGRDKVTASSESEAQLSEDRLDETPQEAETTLHNGSNAVVQPQNTESALPISFWKAEDFESDLSKLWADAIEDFCRDTGEDVGNFQVSPNFAVIREEQDKIAAGFDQWRTGDSLHNLRTAISSNSEIILAIAGQVSDLTSSAFPPATALLNGFTWVLKAGENVTENLDMIGSFFDLMSSFLGRVYLIEGKIPAIPEYQKIMGGVFISILDLCRIAASYEKKSLFKQWAIALWEGSDSKLKDAFTTLSTNIQRLESATLFVTLRQSIETHGTITDVAGNLKRLTTEFGKVAISIEKQGNLVEDLQAVTQQRLSTKEFRIHMAKFWEHERQKERAKGIREGEKDNQKNGPIPDAGARRSSALARIKAAFPRSVNPYTVCHDIPDSPVPGTCTWITEHGVFKEFTEKKIGELNEVNGSILLVLGDRGMGKSNLSTFVNAYLQTVTAKEPRTVVVHFTFQKGERSLRDFLKSIITQFATKDPGYRAEVARELNRANPRDIKRYEDEAIWDQFIVSKLEKNADAALILVVDGLDEAKNEDRREILRLLSRTKGNGPDIRSFITSRPDVMEDAKSFGLQPLEITKTHIEKDMEALIKAKMDKYRRLKRQLDHLTLIPQLFVDKSESFLYVETALDVINSYDYQIRDFTRMGKSVKSQIQRLPSPLFDLYDSILLGIEMDEKGPEKMSTDTESHTKGRGTAESGYMKELRALFAWVTYSRRPITLAEASTLLTLVDKDCVFSIEEEADGRCSRFLKLYPIPTDGILAVNTKGPPETDPPEATDDVSGPEFLVDSRLTFRNRSVWDYFQQLSSRPALKNSALRITPSAAHRIILEQIAAVLQMEAEDATSGIGVIYQLQRYAAETWVDHFLEIDWAKTTDMNDLASVMTSIWTISTNQNGALKRVEELSTAVGLFGNSEEHANRMTELVHRCAGVLLPHFNLLRLPVLRWVNSIFKDKRKYMETIAKGHRWNWLRLASPRLDSVISYQFAYSAEKLARTLNGTSPDLGAPNLPSTIREVSEALPSVSGSEASTNRAIGQVMIFYEHYDEGIHCCEAALASTTEPLERLQTLISIADIRLCLAKRSRGSGDLDEETYRKKQLDDCQIAVDEALDIYKRFPKKEKEQESVKGFAKLVYERYSAWAVLSEDLNMALNYGEEASRLSKDYSTDFELLNSITTALQRAGEYVVMISLVSAMVPVEKAHWLSSNTHSLNNENFQYAAAITNSHELLIGCYEQAIQQTETVSWSQGASLKLSLATYLFRVAKEGRKAMKLLKEVLNNDPDGDIVQHGIIARARLELADIYMHDFRNSTKLAKKQSILDSMKSLAFPTALGQMEVDPYTSYTSFMTAVMHRTVGSFSEFESILNQVFAACVKALTDKTSENDSQTLRLFSRILTCLPNLTMHAEIAYACQFYVVNPQLLEHSNANDNQIARDPREERGGDVHPNWIVRCNGCSMEHNVRTGGRLYQCLICSDCDLCQSCFDKRDEENWKSFCGKDHLYIKYPPSDWQAVKGGVIQANSKEIEFGDWLRVVESDWKSAWDSYWEGSEGIAVANK